MKKPEYNKHVWEGWTVQDFIDALQPQADVIMAGQSWHKPFRTMSELSAWCTDNQPYYKKPIPEVMNYFAQRYGIE